jgi:tetratricopeptide (TPR) repeat protein
LELFRQVCSAAHYAHEKRIVHRDIKPANILVTSQGIPKLLDFGIAKLLDADGQDLSARMTMPGVRLMTLDYASPEQVLAKPITPVTDVYALGAVLYELLTGRQAQRVTSLSTAEIEEEICHREPARPSLVANGLDRDLDNIVLKALCKEPSGRYLSAKQFAEDIDRFLQGLPIQARRASLLYRCRKFLKRRRSTVVTASVTGAAAAVLVGTAAYIASHSKPILAERDSLVIADVANKTGDPVFDDVLRQALSVKLAESPYINALTDEQMDRTLRLMGWKGRVTPQIGRDVCLRNGAKAVVSGSIARLGEQYVLSLDATNCGTGESLAHTGAQVMGKDRVLTALGRAATELRRKLGESLSSVQRFDKPFEATSSSLEALQAYTMSRKARQEGRRGDQLALLKRATELDPEFAYAFAALSAEYSNLKDADKAYQYGRRAFDLQDRVTEREKFYLLDRYYGAVTGQLEERIQSARLWSLTYPRDYMAYAGLSSAYGYAGRIEEALAAALEVFRLNPDGATAPWVNAIGYYAALGRLDDAKRVYEEAKRRGVSYSHLPVLYYTIAFLRRDESGMTEAVRQAMRKDGGDYEILIEEACTASFWGRIQNARELMERAITSAQRTKNTSRIARAYAARAHIEALFGMRGPARQDAIEALRLAPEPDVLALSGSSLARSGDPIRARTTAETLKMRYPLNTTVNSIYLPIIHAEIENAAKRSAAALETLNAAVPYELATNGLTLTMYPVYLRAEAALRARDPQRAAGEFQKILDRPGMVGNTPLGPLSRLGSARAYAAAGDRVNSCNAYTALMDIWKDADPAAPVVAEARRESATNCAPRQPRTKPVSAGPNPR